MIDAKGGVEALHENWRLELVVYLWVQLATSTSGDTDIVQGLINVTANMARIRKQPRPNISLIPYSTV